MRAKFNYIQTSQMTYMRYHKLDSADSQPFRVPNYAQWSEFDISINILKHGLKATSSLTRKLGAYLTRCDTRLQDCMEVKIHKCSEAVTAHVGIGWVQSAPMDKTGMKARSGEENL